MVTLTDYSRSWSPEKSIATIGRGLLERHRETWCTAPHDPSLQRSAMLNLVTHTGADATPGTDTGGWSAL